MSTASSSVSMKSGDGVSDQFPAGLRVLVVDDDPTCLMILEKMLQTCLYYVTKCNRAEKALSMLRQNKNGFDIVISDVHMPDMDGFKLLEYIGLEMDLPVIMMSADDGKNVVMKGVTHGACDYLIKPVRIEALRNIWQHVVRKRRNEWKEQEQSGSVEEGSDRQQKFSEDGGDYSSSANEGNWKNASKKRNNEDEEETEEREDGSTLKKPRVVWSIELHQQFVAAVNQLGIDKAVPKKILELMNVPGLTRENVASHLQKYRLYLRRLSGVAQHPSNLSTSFIMGSQETTFGPMSSLSGLDLQTLAATGQLSPQSLATFQASGLSSRPGKSTTLSGMPLVDHRNIFSFENPKPNSKPLMSLLHSNSVLMQSQPSEISSNILGSRVSSSSLVGQSIIANGYTNGGGVSYNNNNNNLVQPSSSMMNFPTNQTQELPGNNFLVQSKGSFPEEGNSDVKSSGRLLPVYNIYSSYLEQPKSQYWDMQNVAPTFNGSQQNAYSVQGEAMFSLDEVTEQVNTQNMGQQLSCVLDNSIRVKVERIYDAESQTGIFPDHLGQEDLLSALLKQQQDGAGWVESEFSFDGFPADNIHA